MVTGALKKSVYRGLSCKTYLYRVSVETVSSESPLVCSFKDISVMRICLHRFINDLLSLLRLICLRRNCSSSFLWVVSANHLSLINFSTVQTTVCLLWIMLTACVLRVCYRLCISIIYLQYFCHGRWPNSLMLSADAKSLLSLSLDSWIPPPDTYFSGLKYSTVFGPEQPAV